MLAHREYRCFLLETLFHPFQTCSHPHLVSFCYSPFQPDPKDPDIYCPQSWLMDYTKPQKINWPSANSICKPPKRGPSKIKPNMRAINIKNVIKLSKQVHMKNRRTSTPTGQPALANGSWTTHSIVVGMNTLVTTCCGSRRILAAASLSWPNLWSTKNFRIQIPIRCAISSSKRTRCRTA